MKKLTPLLIVALGLSGITPADQIVRYNLNNVSFDGYTNASGYFSWDWTTNAPADCNIIDGGGRFYLGGSYPATVTTSSIDGSYDYQNISYGIALVFKTPVTPNAGAAIDPSLSTLTVDLSGNGGGITVFKSTGGSVQAVPEPSTLACCAILGLGWIGKRRKTAKG